MKFAARNGCGSSAKCFVAKFSASKYADLWFTAVVGSYLGPVADPIFWESVRRIAESSPLNSFRWWSFYWRRLVATVLSGNDFTGTVSCVAVVSGGRSSGGKYKDQMHER